MEAVETPATFTCWCGESGTYDELYDDAGLELACGGTREIACWCGGDFCVCHNHGWVRCEGCMDCDPWGEPP